MNNPSLQARAEMGLLQALNQERKSTAKTKVIGKFEVPPKEVMLRARKAHEKHQKLRSEEEDRDIVASLHHQPIDPHMRHKEFPKLARKRIMKRTTHDSTVKQFEVSRLPARLAAPPRRRGAPPPRPTALSRLPLIFVLSGRRRSKTDDAR